MVEGREERQAATSRSSRSDFLLYGALAEIFARTTGFNRGPRRIDARILHTVRDLCPNNAIVGGAAPVALGAALYKRANQKKGIVIANFGDGACGRGPVLESFNYRPEWIR